MKYIYTKDVKKYIISTLSISKMMNGMFYNQKSNNIQKNHEINKWQFFFVMLKKVI
jgi:hypothetical protein